MVCSKCGAQVPDGWMYCPVCGAYLSQQSKESGVKKYKSFSQTEAEKYQGYPMKWHQCLVYGLLWLGAVSNCFTGMHYMTGSHWKDMKETAYRLFPGFQTADMIFGAGAFLTSVLGFIAIFKLLRLRAHAPRWLLAYYIVSGISSMLYFFLLESALGEFAKYIPLSQSGLFAGIGCVVMVVINKVYYDKRSELFVN